MIAIQKGPAPPGLISAGEEHAKELCAAYDADPAQRCLVLTGSEKAFAAGADIKEMQAQGFASMYGSNFFPTLHTLQAYVFEKSLAGPWIKENLSSVLISPTAPEAKEIHQKEAKWN